MLIFALFKGVPSRTTRVVTVSGVLKREEMEIVMNPPDAKAMEAADFIKRRTGGKIVAISMGPEAKVRPIARELFEEAAESKLVPRISTRGIDEAYVLSDRRMAGADTLATAYTVALGVKRVLDIHLNAIDDLMRVLEMGSGVDDVYAKAKELYDKNLLPNKVFSELAAVKSTIIGDYVSGTVQRDDALVKLKAVKDELQKFIIVAGIKTTDGETGSTGPQVAEALSEALGYMVPHITYVRDFELNLEEGSLYAERKLGNMVQLLRSSLPVLMTISPDYRPRPPPASVQKEVRARNYKGKNPAITVLSAEAIGADPSKIGLQGSPTLVGPGVDVAAPPVQKVLGKTLIFRDHVEAIEYGGTLYGPFEKGSVVRGLPEGLVEDLKANGLVEPFTIDHLIEDLFTGILVTARQVYREVEEKAGYRRA